MPDKKQPQRAKTAAFLKKPDSLKLSILKQMVTLSTSGFGLIAALAWNNVIQELVDSYVKPYLARGSGLVSLLIYAVIITVIAVVFTYQLTKLIERLERR